MKTKTEDQRFVFPDMSYQDFPHTIDREDCVVVSKLLELSQYVYVDGALVPKTSEELAAEAANAEAAEARVLQDTLGSALDSKLDSTAQLFGYDDIKSVVTYADEPAVPRFQNEGIEFRKWRSLCYAYAYDQLEAFHSEGSTPTVEDFLSGLPPLNLILPE